MGWFRVIVLAGLMSGFGAAAAGAAEKGVHLFALGDWGLNSPDRQTTADAMAKWTESGRPDAVLLMGDNFYVSLKGVDDPQILAFFEKTYDPVKLDMPFYAVLGNHDYKTGDDSIELAYAAKGNTRFKMPAHWYRLDLPAVKPLVTVLMLDSDQPLMSKEMWAAEMKWMGEELAKPHAPWLVCAAHHDMFGNGNHGDNGVLQTTWGPLFKQYNVDFYLCGHEHTLQHLEIGGVSTSFVVAGGGGAVQTDVEGSARSVLHCIAGICFDPFHR